MLKHKYIIIFLILFILIISLYSFIQVNNAEPEPFMNYLQGHIRPHIRQARLHYEHFENNYGPNIITNNVKKWIKF
jgi:ferredoxin-NADP reductase